MYFYTKPALCAALLAVGCYFFTSRAIAQSDTTTVTTQSLTPITISSIKVGTQSASISDIDRSLRPVNTAQDLLRLVPGLFIAQHAGGGKAEQIFLRGFDCDHGTDFNISIDGMPVNMVSHAHGQGYADFHFVIPETVDRLRVYRVLIRPALATLPPVERANS